MSGTDPMGDLEARVRLLESRAIGPFRAFVADNADPKKLGRLKLIIPEVLGDVLSGWAEPAAPYGGTADMGSFRVPPITKNSDGAFTTGVWVQFRAGNVSFPVWFGTFWGAPGGTTEAPGDTGEADPDVHIWRTMSGHSLIGVDTARSERVELHDAAGQKLVLTAKLNTEVKRDANGAVKTTTSDVAYGDLSDTNPTAQLVDFAGNSLTLSADQSTPTVTILNTNQDGSVTQTITLSGGSSAWIEVADNNKNTVRLDDKGITLTSEANSDTVTMNSEGISVQASKGQVTVDGQTKVIVKSATQVQVTAPEVQVSGSAKVAVSGGQVTVSGSTQVSISAPAVTLN